MVRPEPVRLAVQYAMDALHIAERDDGNGDAAILLTAMAAVLLAHSVKPIERRQEIIDAVRSITNEEMPLPEAIKRLEESPEGHAALHNTGNASKPLPFAAIVPKDA